MISISIEKVNLILAATFLEIIIFIYDDSFFSWSYT